MYYSELTCLIKTRMLFDIKCCSISDFPNVFLRILKLFISHKSHSQVSKFSMSLNIKLFLICLSILNVCFTNYELASTSLFKISY